MKNTYDYGKNWYCPECGQAKECQDGLDDDGSDDKVYTEAQMYQMVMKASRIFRENYGVTNAYHILMRISNSL
jgi:hypothetical protein